MNNKKNSDNQMQYMPIGMCLGMSIGTAIGAATDNLAIGMSIGLSIGMCIGVFIDAKNRKSAKEDRSSNADTETDEQQDT